MYSTKIQHFLAPIIKWGNQWYVRMLGGSFWEYLLKKFIQLVPEGNAGTDMPSSNHIVTMR